MQEKHMEEPGDVNTGDDAFSKDKWICEAADTKCGSDL